MRDDTQTIIQKMDENEAKLQPILSEKFYYWVDNIIFTWQWWFGVGLTVLPWLAFCYFYHRKATFDRLLHVGFLVIIISVLLDTLGDQHGFWHYRFNVLPAVPTYFPWDFTLMPMSIMLLLIIKPMISHWIKAVVFALAASYIGEPLFVSIHVYSPDRWKYSYSVPIQVVIYLTAHWLYTRRYKFAAPQWKKE
jgi:hypothetical protein